MFPFLISMSNLIFKLTFWFATLLNLYFFSFQYFSWVVPCNKFLAILLSCLYIFTTTSRKLNNSLTSRKICLTLDFNETKSNILLIKSITLAFNYHVDKVSIIFLFYYGILIYHGHWILFKCLLASLDMIARYYFSNL